MVVVVVVVMVGGWVGVRASGWVVGGWVSGWVGGWAGGWMVMVVVVARTPLAAHLQALLQASSSLTSRPLAAQQAFSSRVWVYTVSRSILQLTRAHVKAWFSVAVAWLPHQAFLVCPPWISAAGLRITSRWKRV